MKKMSFKCIFNWLYAKTLNRAMSDRQPREDRETISPVYRPVRVSYVSRISLVLLLLVGMSTNVWAVSRSWKAGVAVEQGQGTVKVTIYKHDWWHPDQESKYSIGEDAQKQASNKTVKTAKDSESRTLETNISYRSCWYEVVSISNGYKWLGWYDGSGNQKTTSRTYKPWTRTKDNKNETYYAKFTPIEVSAVSDPSSINVNTPSEPTVDVSFTVTKDAQDKDFDTPTISGDGWSYVSTSISGTTATVKVKFTATATTTQGEHKATVTLTSKGTSENQSKEATVCANVDLSPSLVADPTSLDFGMFTIKVDSKMNKTVSLTYNVNTTNITLTDDASLAPFSATRIGSTVTVYYEPTAVGTFEKTLTITALNSQATQLSKTQTITLKGQAQSITWPEYTCKIKDNYMVDDEAIDLQSLWTSTSNGTITYSIEEYTEHGSNNSASSKPAISDNRYLSLGRACKVKLKLTQASATSYYASSDEKTIIVSKYSTSFTGSAYNLMVDGTQTADYGYTNTSAAQPTANSSDDFYYTIDNVSFTNAALNKGANLVTFDPSNKQITACNAGTAKITFHQKETYNYTGATKSFDVAVYKYNSVFANVADLNVKVDANVSSAYTLTYTKPNAAYIGAANHAAGTPGLNEASGDFYYTLAQSVKTDVTAGSPDASLAITYDAANKKATGKNQGTGTIHLYQKETYKYNAADEDFVVTVSKHKNAFSCSWGGWSNTMNFDSETAVTFSSNNPDAASRIVTQTDGAAVATYSAGKIVSNHHAGTATWSVTQAETYKYKPASATCTMTVGTIDAECYVLNEPAEHSMGKYGDSTFPKAGKASYTYSWTEEGAVLKFKMWKYSGANDIGNYVTLYDGAGAKIGNDYNYSIGSMSTSPTEYTITLPAGVRSVKFRNGTGAWEGASTLNTYISHVKVTRSTWLNLQDKDGNSISSLSMPTLRVNNTSTSATFYVDYSTCADVIKLVSNNSHITFFDTNTTTYQFNSDGSGRKEIKLTYTNASIGDVSAVVTVYTPYENKTLSISAKTDRNNQEIVWATGYEGATVSLPVGLVTSSAATATSELPVIYSVRSEDADVISIRDDGASFEIIGKGTAQLTATQEGDKDYNPTSSTKIINATDKKIQVIQWGQNFTRALALSEVHTLQADVYLRDIVTATSTYSAARSELLTYTCPNANGVISVSGNKMTILGYGQTTVTAHVAGSEDYEEAAPVTLIVKVLEPSAGCETPLVLNKESLQLFSMDIDWGEWTTPQITSDPILIDRTIGKPDKLSFQHEGEEYPIPYFSNIKVYRGAIKVQQRVNGSWSDVEGSQIEPTKYVWNQLSDLQLKEDADAIRFVRLVKGQGYHNIKDIQVTLLQYLRTNEPLVDFGNVPAGAVLETTLGFEYSDVKGNLNAMVGAAEPIFTVEENPVEMVCGAAGHYDLPVRFAPKAIGTWENSVTVLDPITKKTVTINVKANVTKGSQSISWNPVLNLYANETVALNATATSGLEVSYNITEGSDVAEIRNGVVVILQPGTFTITASQSGTRDFNPAEPVVKTFTVSPIVLTLTAPTASSINASQTLNESALTGGSAKDGDGNEVAGTWAWQNSSATYSAGEHTPTVVFTPSTNPAWYSGTTTTTALTVTGVEYIFTNGHGDSEWDETSNWAGGNKPSGNDKDVIIRGNLTIDDEVVVKSLTIEENYNVTLTVGGQLTVGDGDSQNRTKYGDLHVLKGGQVVLNEGKLKVNNFILDASLNGLDAEAQVQAAASGQVTNPGNIDKQGEAYFDLSFDPSGKISYGWYDFTVPFEVNISGGISRIGSADDRLMVSGTDFLIMEADEANRSNGGKGWRTLNGGALQPGKLYSITFNYQASLDQNTFRFKWNRNGSLGNGDHYDTQFTDGSVESLRGWNGMGNGMLRHGYIASGYKMQAFNHANNAYELLDGNKTFAIGSAFFVQVPSAQILNWTEAEATNARPLYAPQREAREVEEFRITLSTDMTQEDVLYFSASEEATDGYMIGHDLLKMGTMTDSKVARMWATKGGKNLCDIEATLYNNSASTPLSLYAPQNGQYTLTVDEAPEDANLYLTYNGSVIWDMTASPYSLDLTKGTTEGYGLQLEVINAPQITTGVDEINGEKEGNRKVLINNAMYIITKEGAIFNATGKKVK